MLCCFLPYNSMNQPQVYMYRLPLESPSQPSKMSHSTGLSSLCYIATSHQLPVLPMVIYMFQCCFVNSSHPFLSLLCLQVCSLCLHVYFCPVNRFISTVFLESIYVCLGQACACSAVSNSVTLQPARFLCPRNSPGSNTGVSCHFLLQGIFQPRD